MTTLTKTSPLVLAAVMLLAGCVLSKPELYVDPFVTTGKTPPTFAAGDVPTLYYNLPKAQKAGIAIKVRKQPAGITVKRVYAAATNSRDFEDRGIDTDHPTRWDSPKKIQLQGLTAGDYTAELWIKGRRENTLSFSVRTNEDHPPLSPVERSASAGPGSWERIAMTTRSSTNRNTPDPAVDELDAIVGLTDKQKTEAAKTFLAENEQLRNLDSNALNIEKRFSVRWNTHAQIRTLLTPDQQKLYDDDGVAGRAAEQAVERLRQQVGLTPEQETQVSKIYLAEHEQLQAFAAPMERAEKGADIRKDTREKIRTLLTPEQLKLFAGSGPINRTVEHAVERLDQLVGLTPEQKTEVTKILSEQNQALQAFTSPDDRMEKGGAIRQNARKQIRSLLTPSQQAIYDQAPQRLGGTSMQDPDNPNRARLRETSNFVMELVKKSPAIAARLGAITWVAPSRGDDTPFTATTKSSEISDATPRPTGKQQLSGSAKGFIRFKVHGTERTETLTVHWEKESESAPIKIVRIEGNDGKVIPQ